MEGLELMDWMLEEAKKSPMKIHHDFDTRFRVWVDQIIPSRIDAIRQCGGDLDYTVRMIRLTQEDAERLAKRANREYFDGDHPISVASFAARREAVLIANIKSNSAYLNEVKQ